MNFKRIIIELAVMVLAEKTTIVRKSDPMESFISGLFGLETEEERLARGIEETLDAVTSSVKQTKIDREFKKITSNM
jgi:hypothetical protein